MNTYLAAVLTFFAILAPAQIGTSTITGRVTDSTGAVVPNVSIQIIQSGTNFSFTTVSNSEGIYRVPSLQPGRYRVTFESPWIQEGRAR
jgi:protocatechuate 3,4-dioxygenase beta subunit